MAKEFGHLIKHQRYAGRAADEEDGIELRVAGCGFIVCNPQLATRNPHPRVGHGLAAGGDGALHQRLNKVIERRPRELHGENLPRLGGELGREIVVLAEVAFGHFGGQAQLLLQGGHGAEGGRQAGRGQPVLADGAVEVVAAEVGVAVGTQYLEDALVQA